MELLKPKVIIVLISSPPSVPPVFAPAHILHTVTCCRQVHRLFHLFSRQSLSLRANRSSVHVHLFLCIICSAPPPPPPPRCLLGWPCGRTHPPCCGCLWSHRDRHLLQWCVVHRSHDVMSSVSRPKLPPHWLVGCRGPGIGIHPPLTSSSRAVPDFCRAPPTSGGSVSKSTTVICGGGDKV